MKNKIKNKNKQKQSLKNFLRKGMKTKFPLHYLTNEEVNESLTCPYYSPLTANNCWLLKSAISCRKWICKEKREIIFKTFHHLLLLSLSQNGSVLVKLLNTLESSFLYFFYSVVVVIVEKNHLNILSSLQHAYNV